MVAVAYFSRVGEHRSFQRISLNLLPKLLLTFVYRETNRVADLLARTQIDQPKGTSHLVSRLPSVGLNIWDNWPAWLSLYVSPDLTTVTPRAIQASGWSVGLCNSSVWRWIANLLFKKGKE